MIRSSGRRATFLIWAFVAGIALAATACREGGKEPGRGPAPMASAPVNAALDPERLYAMNCGRCHLPDGRGVAGIAPPLKDDPVVTDRDAGELIRVVLYGVGGKTVAGQEYPSRMPGFSEILSDEEIAAVVNHTRTRWGQHDSRVTPADVQKERQNP